jgi:flagellar biosynthesis/type III secretory pathway M-ring protein FliF/YscJ
MAELDAFEESLDTGDDNRQASGKPRSSRRWIIIGAVVSLLLVVGIAGFFFQTRSGNTIKKKGLAGQGMTQAEQKAKEAEKNKKKRKIKYIELYPQLTQAQAADVTRELSYDNIDFEIQQNGKNYGISVDETRIDEAKMSLAIKGVPFGTAQGYQLLDGGQTLGVTEFDKRVRFVRALSGELENAVRNMADIETCRVQVVLPEQRLFAVTQPPVTAAVMIRKTPDGDLSDNVVFAIIQYVSSAVENLQPENITVVDMVEGKVLSDGIFERIAANQTLQDVPVLDLDAGDLVESGPAPENARPVIPDFDEIQQWYEVKEKYEQSLITRATKQLVGILPVGSFKIAITADLGPLESGEVVDVKRLTTSIVIDNSRDDIFLEADLKSEIFNTVAASIGYVRGRDMILLNRADFALMTPEEKAALEASLRARDVIRTGLLLAGSLIGLIVLLLIGRRTYLRMKASRKSKKEKRETDDFESGLLGTDSKTRETDFGSMQSELDKEKRFEPVRNVADTDPEVLAQIMEDWLADSQPVARL